MSNRVIECINSNIRMQAHEADIGPSVAICPTDDAEDQAQRAYFKSQWASGPKTAAHATEILGHINDGTYRSAPPPVVPTPPAPMTSVLVTPYDSRLLRWPSYMEVLSVGAPLLLISDYNSAIVPSSTPGTVGMGLLGFPGLRGASVVYGEEHPFYLRLEQMEHILGNYVLGSSLRPTVVTKAPQDKITESDQDGVKVQDELMRPLVLRLDLAGRQTGNAERLLKTAVQPTNPVSTLFSAGLDTTSLISTAFEQTNTIDGTNTDRAIQHNNETRARCDLITCPADEIKGKNLGAQQSLIRTINKPLLEASQNLLESTRIADRYDLYLRLDKNFGTPGAIGAVALSLGAYAVSIVEPWNKHTLPTDKFGRKTPRGERIYMEGAQIPFDLLSAYLANGDADYAVTFELTSQRLHDMLTNYYPKQFTDLGNEWQLGEHGMDLGMDPAMAGYGLGSFYSTFGNSLKGYADYARNKAHPDDWRNTLDFVTNLGIDTASIIRTKYYVDNKDNHAEKGAPFTLLGIKLDVPDMVMASMIASIGMRYITQYGLAPFFSYLSDMDSAPRPVVGVTPDGTGPAVGLSLEF